jgi:hypothetical protein
VEDLDGKLVGRAHRRIAGIAARVTAGARDRLGGVVDEDVGRFVRRGRGRQRPVARGSVRAAAAVQPPARGRAPGRRPVVKLDPTARRRSGRRSSPAAGRSGRGRGRAATDQTSRAGRRRVAQLAWPKGDRSAGTSAGRWCQGPTTNRCGARPARRRPAQLVTSRRRRRRTSRQRAARVPGCCRGPSTCRLAHQALSVSCSIQSK